MPSTCRSFNTNAGHYLDSNPCGMPGSQRVQYIPSHAELLTEPSSGCCNDKMNRPRENVELNDMTGWAHNSLNLLQNELNAISIRSPEFLLTLREMFQHILGSVHIVVSDANS